MIKQNKVTENLFVIFSLKFYVQILFQSLNIKLFLRELF